MARRRVQVEETLAHLAGEFLERESNVKALITVTHADVTDNYRAATVYFSVLPRSMEDDALLFAKRARSDFRSYLQKRSSLHPAPVVDFDIDYGEKNRQRIDELTRERSSS